MLSRKKTSSLIPVRIGSLLISSNLVKPDAMANALMVARQMGRRVGEVLIQLHLVTTEDLRSALEVQKLIKDGSITMEMGTRALRQSHDHRRSVIAVLGELGWSNEKTIRSNDLADVLMESGCINRAQLEQASWNAGKNQLPLGRNLVLAGAITPSVLGAALNALILLRDNLVSPEVAVSGVRFAAQKKVPLEEALHLHVPIAQNHVRIGELLSIAGLLSESDSMTAVERGLLNQKSIGQMLLETHMISPLVLDATLKLQKMIEQGKMSRVQAAELLRQVATKQVRLEDFLSEMSYLKSRVLQLLLLSGVIAEEHVVSALAASDQSESDLLQALFASDILSQDLFRLAVRCIYGLDEGTLAPEHACAQLQEASLKLSTAARRSA